MYECWLIHIRATWCVFSQTQRGHDSHNSAQLPHFQWLILPEKNFTFLLHRTDRRDSNLYGDNTTHSRAKQERAHYALYPDKHTPTHQKEGRKRHLLVTWSHQHTTAATGANAQHSKHTNTRTRVSLRHTANKHSHNDTHPHRAMTARLSMSRRLCCYRCCCCLLPPDPTICRSHSNWSTECRRSMQIHKSLSTVARGGHEQQIMPPARRRRSKRETERACVFVCGGHLSHRAASPYRRRVPSNILNWTGARERMYGCTVLCTVLLVAQFPCRRKFLYKGNGLHANTHTPQLTPTTLKHTLRWWHRKWWTHNIQ